MSEQLTSVPEIKAYKSKWNFILYQTMHQRGFRAFDVLSTVSSEGQRVIKSTRNETDWRIGNKGKRELGILIISRKRIRSSSHSTSALSSVL